MPREGAGRRRPPISHDTGTGGLSFKLLGLREIRALANRDGQAEYTRVGDLHWYRGPLSVRASVLRSFELDNIRKIDREPDRTRSLAVECRKSLEGWSCRGSQRQASVKTP